VVFGKLWRYRSTEQFLCRHPNLLYQKHTGAVMRPVPLAAVAGQDLIPQAIISRPLSHFAGQLKTSINHERDDFDEYDVIVLMIDDGIIDDGLVFELKHYAGYPDNTTTIYLPKQINNVGQISDMIGIIARDLHIPREWVVWQRSDDPDL
jgi:hypothetical protein